MPDLHKMLQQKMDEVQKKHPDLSLRWLDSNPEVLRERTQTDGWNVYKESDQTKAGTVGEIKVGDLVLGARPRKESEEERRSQAEQTRNQLHAPLNQFQSDIERLGGSGERRYLKPLMPDEVARDKKWRGDR